MDLAEKKTQRATTERMEVERSTQVDDGERGELKKKTIHKILKI